MSNGRVQRAVKHRKQHQCSRFPCHLTPTRPTPFSAQRWCSTVSLNITWAGSGTLRIWLCSKVGDFSPIQIRNFASFCALYPPPTPVSFARASDFAAPMCTCEKFRVDGLDVEYASRVNVSGARPFSETRRSGDWFKLWPQLENYEVWIHSCDDEFWCWLLQAYVCLRFVIDIKFISV